MTVFTHTTTIVALAAVCVVFLLLFATFRRAAGGKYLDELISRSKSQTLVDDLKPTQVATHIWVTRVLDTMFPACYGLCLAAITLRFSSTANVWLILPIIFAVSADYLENWSQLTALETKRVPSTKPLFSAAKWTCLGLSIVIALYACVIALYAWLFP